VTLPPAPQELVVHAFRGSVLHELLCDAVLKAGGYTWVDGIVYEVIGVLPDKNHAAANRWLLIRPKFVASC
jgi:hypothetical protein